MLRRVAITRDLREVKRTRLTRGPRPAHRQRVRTRLATSMLSLVLVCASGGCAADPSELAPTEALTAFLAALERSTHAPDQRKLAVSLHVK